jgi:D-alanine-D-alanine ligase
VLHGKNGEDGTVQGLLELAEIPMVGCDTASSAACMDKTFTNSMLAYNGIKKPAFYWFYAYDFKKDPEKHIAGIEKAIKCYPMFVKPANAGSSVGITKVSNKEELIKGIEIAALEDKKILVEQGIVGREVECAVLGNEDPIASVTGEIVPSNDFYDYNAKYLSGSSELFIPARIPEDVSEEVRETAIHAYKIMGCSGLARVDFFVEKDTDKVLLNEINTFPGFTSISMYPKLLNESGIGFAELIDRLIELSIGKKQVKISL